MATVQSNGTSTHSQFMRISEAAQLANVHENTLRRAAESSDLKTYRLPSGHRRFQRQDVLEWLGLGQKEEAQHTNQLIIYARVSSNRQGRGFIKGEESDLTRQIDRLKAFAIEKCGREPDEILADTGSGLSYSRKNFVRLIDGILSGKFDGATLLVTYPDRLCRFGRELVEQVAVHHQVTIRYVENDGEVSDEEELSQDVVAVITHFSAKVHGARAAKQNTKTLTPDCLTRAKQLYDSGLSQKQVVVELNKEGWRTEQNEEIRLSVIRRTLHRDARPILEQAIPKGQSSSERFINQQCVDAPDSAVYSKDVYEAYQEWCRRENLTAARHKAFSIELVPRVM